MAQVVRQNSEVEGEGNSSKDNIEIRDELAPTAKKGTDLGETFHNGIVEAKNEQGPKEVPKCL